MIKRLLGILFVIIISSSWVNAEENFSYYIKDVRQIIDTKWIAPVYYNRHTAEVNFKINKDGSISDIKLTNPAKIKQMDKKIIETISEIKSFEPLPKQYKGKYIEVSVLLSNYIKSDMKNPFLYKKKNNLLYKDSLPISTKFVKIKKVVYTDNFSGSSNYKDKMKDLALNIDIERSKK